NPTAIAIDPTNRIYVADFINHRINVYQLVNTNAGDSFLDPLAETKGSDEAEARRAEIQTSDDAPTKGGEL
ncbi:MAG: hypothetical protein ACYSUI_03610, partial [Planctomycetota bacterium]